MVAIDPEDAIADDVDDALAEPMAERIRGTLPKAPTQPRGQRLSDAGILAVLDQIHAARRIEDSDARTSVLISIGSRLSGDIRLKALIEAGFAARTIPDRIRSVHALARILSLLPQQEREPILFETREAASAITDKPARISVLTMLAALPPEGEAFDLVGDGEDGPDPNAVMQDRDARSSASVISDDVRSGQPAAPLPEDVRIDVSRNSVYSPNTKMDDADFDNATRDIAARMQALAERTNRPVTDALRAVASLVTPTAAADSDSASPAPANTSLQMITADMLFGGAPPPEAKARQKYVFPDEMLRDPKALRQAESIANARTYKKRTGNELSPDDDARGKMAASFVKQAKRRQLGNSEPR